MSISEHKHMSEPEWAPTRRIEVFTGAGRRRTWSADQKAAIVADSFVEGASVCDVARRYGLTPQQLFTWRRQARKGPEAREEEYTGYPRGATLNMSQSIFDAGRTTNSVRQAESSVFAARATMRNHGGRRRAAIPALSPAGRL